jgi:hypothetical protein
MIKAAYIAACTALLSTSAVYATMPPKAVVDHIEMQLFYIYSGTLSENIAKPSEFTGWNTVIGEGDAKEPADDVLVTVHLQGTSESGEFVPVSIIAKNSRGKIIGKRIAEPALADKDGKAVVALMLYDVTCAGTITVTAKMGRALVKKNTASLPCGE